MSIVCTSGGFDPLHYGHIQYLREASKLADEHIVILNGNSFLLRKKGYYCFDAEERRDILLSFPFVHRVFILNRDNDDTVNSALYYVRPTIFAKGGDRGPGNVPEEEVCLKLGIDIVYGVGGNDKFNSSSDIIARAFRMKYGKEFLTAFA
jgi:cytidyltransferase-like protein